MDHISVWTLMCFSNQFVPLPKVDLGRTDAGICWGDHWPVPSFGSISALVPSAVGAYGFVTFFFGVA